MMRTRKVVIFAPFWRDSSHVGGYRVARFVRWLAAAGVKIVIVRAGRTAGVERTSRTVEVTVPDPFGFYGDAESGGGGVQHAPRKPNRLRRYLGYWLFNPDPTVVWAKRAASDPSVLREAAEADVVLASSPPESAHVGALHLAERLGARLWSDLRDGWLDEPLRPVLRDSRLRQWWESRLERRILERAERVFVTSEVWREMLLRRIPALRGRVMVLTNAYPDIEMPAGASPAAEGEMVLLHAGRFTGSSLRRSPELLLDPLVARLRAHPHSRPGRIVLVGRLEDTDRPAIDRAAEALGGTGWEVDVRDQLPRAELMRMVAQAHGLLLLSISDAAIPSKLFEYIPTRRPLLVVTPRESGTWRACAELPQAVLLAPDAGAEEREAAIGRFLELAGGRGHAADVPQRFTEGAIHHIFGEAVGLAPAKLSR
jgi:hypothetical protein